MLWIILAAVILIPLLIAVIRTMLLKAPAPQNYKAPCPQGALDAYAEKYGNKAVRKNLTIPAWLNTFAEKNNINFSQVLQDSLMALYRKQYN